MVHLWSRTGRNWAKDFRSIAEAIALLPVEGVILDGEAVCLLEDGRPDFHALRSRQACREARLIAYDLLGHNGEDLRKLPLHERRTRLESLSSGNDALWFSSNVEGAKGAALFRQACTMGLEGIVSKRIDTPYRSAGASDEMIIWWTVNQLPWGGRPRGSRNGLKDRARPPLCGAGFTSRAPQPGGAFTFSSSRRRHDEGAVRVRLLDPEVAHRAGARDHSSSSSSGVRRRRADSAKSLQARATSAGSRGSNSFAEPNSRLYAAQPTFSLTPSSRHRSARV